jgi:tetratricopeptide (TPR) repeat protein
MSRLLIIWSLFFSLSVHSQNLNDAKQLLYYEKYQSAENLLHQVLKNEPANAEAWFLLTRAYIKEEKSDRLDTIRSAPQQITSEPFYLVSWGNILLLQKSTQKAEEFFNSALEQTRFKNPDILLAVAKAKIESKETDAHQAIDLLHRAIKKDKNSPELYTALGDAYFKLVDGGNAFTAYQQALQKDKRYARAAYQIGLIFKTQKNAEVYLQYFNDAIVADPKFAPAYYQLYNHYYFHNVNAAMKWLEKYIALSDHSIQTEYEYTDLLYLTKNYDAAIAHALALINTEKDKAPARLYKLIAYSQKETGDTLKAFNFMSRYFDAAADSMLVPKDFAMMAGLYESKQKIDSAILFYEKAVEFEKDSAELVNYYKLLADLSKSVKDYGDQALWLEKYYVTKPRPSNVDLFNWGIASFQSMDYEKSDSVFAVYAAKYPEEDFGYYWRARSNAAIDTALEAGSAVPHYLKVIEIDETDTTGTTKRHLIEAYGYLAAYEVNKNKDFTKAIQYFEKLLALDPDNSNAQKNMERLKKWLAKKESDTGS